MPALIMQAYVLASLWVCWDDFDEEIIAFGKITIDKKKKITLKDGRVSYAFVGSPTIDVDDDPNL